MKVDISQCLQAISLPFTDCELNDATINGCTSCFLLFTPVVVSTPYQSPRCGVDDDVLSRESLEVLAADSVGRWSGHEEATSIRISFLHLDLNGDGVENDIKCLNP